MTCSSHAVLLEGFDVDLIWLPGSPKALKDSGCQYRSRSKAFGKDISTTAPNIQSSMKERVELEVQDKNF